MLMCKAALQVRVLGWVGALIILEQSCEIIMYDSPAWRSMGKAIFELVPGY